MTDASDRVAEIRARAEAATPGPWLTPLKCNVYAGEFPEAVATAWPQTNAIFIANAREDIPYLLDRLASAEARVDHANKTLKQYEEQLAGVKQINAHLTERVGELEQALRHLVNNSNGVTAFWRHGNAVSDQSLCDLYDAQLTAEAALNREGVKPQDRCVKCNGFLPGAKPYGHSCGCDALDDCVHWPQGVDAQER